MSMRVLICGGGVIGASIAYFLSRRKVETTVIERTGLACAASGKSGGFLAFDWCDGTPLEPLARRSFTLHARLTQEIGDDWNYRPLTTYGGSMGLRRHASVHGLNWLSAGVSVDQRLGSTETTAQVHPGKFTAAMMRAAEAQGAELRIGQSRGSTPWVTSRRCRGRRRDDRERRLCHRDGPMVDPRDTMAAIAGCIRPQGAQPRFRYRHEGAPGSPFSRSPRGVWCRAIARSLSAFRWHHLCLRDLQRKPAAGRSSRSSPDAGAIEQLERCAARCRRCSPQAILARQACYRPVTRDGLPLIGRVPGVAGAYVATGHSVWGILNAPATGEAMAELIIDGAANSVDLSPFDPGRTPPFDLAGLRKG